MTKLTRKQAEKFAQQFDAEAYAQCTHNRRSLMVVFPNLDIAGYGGFYEHALGDLHCGSFDPSDAEQAKLNELKAAVEKFLTAREAAVVRRIRTSSTRSRGLSRRAAHYGW